MAYLWLHNWRVSAWQHAQWEHLEEEMKAGRDLPGVQTMKMADISGLEWEDEHEFKLHGQMYDVLGMHWVNDGFWEIRCIADADETVMKADFEALLKGSEQGSGQLPNGFWTRLLTATYLDLLAVKLPVASAFEATYVIVDHQVGNAPVLLTLGQPPQYI